MQLQIFIFSAKSYKAPYAFCSMVYHGRIIVTGSTNDGEPFAAYAISGRSQGSKKRLFRRATPETLYVDSLGVRTAEQERLADLIAQGVGLPAVRPVAGT